MRWRHPPAPTHSNDELGNKNWGHGPTVVALRLSKGDPWVLGALVNQVWSLGTSSSAPAYSNMLIQPIVNYNFPGGTYLSFGPQITVNWKAQSGQQWTVPLGGGVGRIVHFGKLPVNLSLAGYYNVVRPDDSPNWQVQLQLKFMFPK